MTDQVWREFCDSFAQQYMNEVFTTDSVREVEFLGELLELPRGAAVLDIGCGTGWNAVETARAGYVVTGLRRPVELDEMEIMAVLRRPPA